MKIPGISNITKLDRRARNYVDKVATRVKANNPELFTAAEEEGKALTHTYMVARMNYLLYCQLKGACEKLKELGETHITYNQDSKKKTDSIDKELKGYAEIINSEHYIEKE